MMTSSKRMFVAVFVVSVCLLLLAACARENKEAADGEQAEQTESSVAEQPAESPVAEGEQTAAANEQLSKFPQPITVTIALGVAEFSQFAEGESIEDNLHTRLNREKLNIFYEPKFVIEDSKFIERMNLAISSDDLPDVMRVDAQQLQRMVKNDQVADLTEVWTMYASDILKEAVTAKEGVALKPVTYGGKMYGIPRTSDFGDSIPMLWIREDWLEKLGKQAPRTIDELLDVARAFVEQDPDGNNEQDTYAIGLDSQLARGNTLRGISAAFHAYPGLWVEDASGKLVYGSIQPEMKPALEVMQKLYQMKAIDPEFAIKDYSKMAESLVAGKIGMLFGLFWNPIYPLQQNVDLDPNAKWVAVPVPGANGEPVIPPANLFAQNFIVVRKGFEYPEAIIKSINMWMEMNKGDRSSELGSWWLDAQVGTYEGLSAHTYALPYHFDMPFRNLETHKQLVKYKESGDESVMDISTKEIWKVIEPGGSPAWGYEHSYFQGIGVLAQYPDYKYSDYIGIQTDTMTSKGANLAKIEEELLVEIVMGAPISKFDEFVEQYMSLGGNEITQEVNQAKADQENQ